MPVETVETEQLSVEVSQNERTKDDKVYFYFEHFNGGDMEVYLSVEDFKLIVNMMNRLDAQLESV